MLADPLVHVAVLVHYAALDLVPPVLHSCSIIVHVVTYNAAVELHFSDLHFGQIPKCNVAVVHDFSVHQSS